MSNYPHNYSKPPLAEIVAPTPAQATKCGTDYSHGFEASYLTWGLSDGDSVVAMQLAPAAVAFTLAVLDLQLRTPALSPVREHRECQMSITLILPSLLWRTVNWCTCCAWIVLEVWGGALDLPALVLQVHCAGDCAIGDEPGVDCSPGILPRALDLGPLASNKLGANHHVTIDDLRGLLWPIAVAAPLLLFINGVLCIWAWQYYSGVHNLYRSLFNHGPEWFKTVATPDAYLSELSGMELILGAADTMLVNLPVCWMASRLYDMGLGLGFFGHINLAVSIVTYILNTWLFADKSPIIDTYRWQVWLLFFPIAWIAMGFTALPALQLLRSGFDPRTMRLNWCCVPRYHHHRTAGFGQNDAVAIILDRERFPWFQQKAWKLWKTSEERRAMLPSLDRNVGNDFLLPLHAEHEAQQRRAQVQALRNTRAAANSASGLSQAMVLSLPTTTYRPCYYDLVASQGSGTNVTTLDETDEADVALCSICYEAVEPGSEIFLMQCPHVQHYDCMKLWVVRKPECPECRQRLALPELAAMRSQLDPSSPSMALPATRSQSALGHGHPPQEITATQRRALARRERLLTNQTERMQTIQERRRQPDPEPEQLVESAQVLRPVVLNEDGEVRGAEQGREQANASAADMGDNAVSVNPLTASQAAPRGERSDGGNAVADVDDDDAIVGDV